MIFTPPTSGPNTTYFNTKDLEAQIKSRYEQEAAYQKSQIEKALLGYQQKYQAQQSAADRANQQSLAGTQASTARYQADQQRAAQQDQAGTQLRLGEMNNATTRQGQQLQYQLGTQQDSTTRQGQKYQYDLGIRSDETTRQGQKYQYDLGVLNDGTNRYGIDTGFKTAQMQDATTQRGQDVQRAIAGEANATNRYGIDRNFDLGVLGNQTTIRGQDIQQAIAGMQDQTNRYGIDTGFRTAQLNDATNRYGIDQTAATSRDNTRYTADTQKAIAQLAEDNKSNRFGQIFGTLSEVIAGGGGQAEVGGNPQFKAGRTGPTLPLRQMFNSGLADNLVTEATANRGIAQQMGARGFGPGSAVGQALMGQTAAARMGADAQMALGLAQQESEQGVKREALANERYGTDVAARTADKDRQTQRFNSILAALAGLA